MPPAPFFADANLFRLQSASFSALSKPLPPNVQVISLDRWNSQQVLLRLAHQFGLGEDAELSKPVNVDLASLFPSRKLLQAHERGLAATISREEVLKRRIPWQVDGEAAPVPTAALDVTRGFDVTLGPLQIRTFLLEFAEDEVEPADMVTYV